MSIHFTFGNFDDTGSIKLAEQIKISAALSFTISLLHCPPPVSDMSVEECIMRRLHSNVLSSAEKKESITFGLARLKTIPRRGGYITLPF